MPPAQGRKGDLKAGFPGYEKVFSDMHSRGLSVVDFGEQHEWQDSEKTLFQAEEVVSGRQSGDDNNTRDIPKTADSAHSHTHTRSACPVQSSAVTVQNLSAMTSEKCETQMVDDSDKHSHDQACSHMKRNGKVVQETENLETHQARPKVTENAVWHVWDKQSHEWKLPRDKKQTCRKVSFGPDTVIAPAVQSSHCHHGPKLAELDRPSTSIDGCPWRNSSQDMVQEPGTPEVGGVGRPGESRDAQGQESYEGDGDKDQCRQPQEVRPTGPGSGDGSVLDRQRDHCRDEAQVTGPCHATHSRTWTRPCGLWETLPQNVSGSVQRDAIIRPVGKGHSQGRRVLPASSTPGNMVGAAGQHQEDSRHQDSPSQDREGGKPFEGCANGDLIRSSQLVQHGNDSDDGRAHEHSEELGSRLGEDEVGEQRGEASDPLRRGRDYFEQRVGGRAQEVMVPDAAHMNYEDDSEPSAELGSLSVSESRSLEWKSSRILPECMEALVQARRPVLYEVACGPNSRLNEKMKQMTGREDSCKRFAFWNGFDVGTSVGVRGIIKEIDQGNPQHVWISLECGPFSKMQQINQRNAKQVEDLKQKRETCIRMYIGGLLIFMHCVQRGITVTWEWAETSDAWRLPMVQNVFAKFAPWFCVVKGCRVQLRDPKGKGLLGLLIRWICHVFAVRSMFLARVLSHVCQHTTRKILLRGFAERCFTLLPDMCCLKS